MAKKKINYLLEKIVGIFGEQKPGRLLDLGCGDGRTGKRFLDKGFNVEACDMDNERFEFKDTIPFKVGNLNNPLPYADNYFDYVIFMEVIEHIYNPEYVLSEINRVLRPGGKLILSTPNILNISSRFRFLIEGSYNFFREPTLDFSKCFPGGIQNMHVMPWRYQELEYLLYKNGLETIAFYTDKQIVRLYPVMLLLKPLLFFHSKAKERRSRKDGSVDFARINKILLSPEMLLGRHLILEGLKK